MGKQCTEGKYVSEWFLFLQKLFQVSNKLSLRMTFKEDEAVRFSEGVKWSLWCSGDGEGHGSSAISEKWKRDFSSSVIRIVCHSMT